MAVYQVIVGGKEYQVEIEDLNAQPVRAVVNGREVQVWVREREVGTVPSVRGAPAKPATVPPTVTLAPPGAAHDLDVCAPMPGSIVSVAVQPGDHVEVGQDMCVLEAMKMNNRIRAHRAGTIAQVHISPGQQVQHGDRLLTFSE